MSISLAAAAILGGAAIIGGATSAWSQQKTNEAQERLQKATNETSIELANTAHQREVADLKAAGLNPVLSAGGSGATTPTLGTAQVQNPMPNMGELAVQTANAMTSAKQVSAQSQLAEAQTDAIPSQIQLNQSESAKNLAEAGYKQKEIDYYIKHGVFPGATTTKSTGTPWGNSSETIPVGIKEPINATSAKKAIEQREKKEKTNKETEEEIKKLKNKYGKIWYDVD